MKKLVLFSIVVLVCLAAGCSSGGSSTKDGSTCDKACVNATDCNLDQYCANGCCLPGCATDADCPGSTCIQATHQCASGTDGGDAGSDPGGSDPGGGDQGGGDQGGSDPGGSDPGGSDPGGDVNCQGNHDKTLGQSCACDAECVPEAPACFKDPLDQSAQNASCTKMDCTVGTGDECPTILATSECTASYANQKIVTYCRSCSPGDHSLTEGTDCGCNMDCVQGAICTKDLTSQNPKQCVMCLGGTPRGFGETCKCDSDCGTDYPSCLSSSKYCSIMNCLNNPAVVCPTGSTCYDFYGVFSYCKKS